MSKFPELQAMLEGNEQWSEALNTQEPDFFATSAKGQSPKVLWFGCSDSRVPETTILGSKPGDIFVHRNIANQFQPDDDSASAVLEFAVMTVGVTHVIVTGHTSCGGCIAAHRSPAPAVSASHTTAAAPSPLGRVLAPLIELRHSLKDGAGLDDLIEENVKAGVNNLVESVAMKSAWAKHAKGEMKPVYIHGWVYDLATGRMRDLGITRGPDV